MRPIQATIHTAALQHNLAMARSCAAKSKVFSVIKANGYGHGMLRVAHALAGSDGFAVLGVDEGVTLREAGFKQVILLLEGVFGSDEIALASQHALAVVVHNEEQLLMLEKTAIDNPLDVYVKLNTGMNRLGLPLARFWGIYDRLRACKAVRDVSLMTHFATADGPQGISEQLSRFNDLTGEMNRPRTLANSAAILRYPETHADWIRPGIMLYGATPFDDQTAAELGLQAAMTLESRIIGVQNLGPGDSVGYGRQFTAEQSMTVGIVACGYADGYPRHAPTGTPVWVAGQRTRTLGRVSMDMLCVDLTGIKHETLGSAVELWGANIPIDEVAKAAGTIGYELMCALASRVPVAAQ